MSICTCSRKNPGFNTILIKGKYCYSVTVRGHELYVHNTHMHATRNHSTNTLVISKCNTNSGLQTFHVRAGHLWNSVPPSIRSELSNMSLRQFKLYASTMSEPV